MRCIRIQARQKYRLEKQADIRYVCMGHRTHMASRDVNLTISTVDLPAAEPRPDILLANVRSPLYSKVF